MSNVHSKVIELLLVKGHQPNSLESDVGANLANLTEWGLDSLDHVELAMQLEQHYHIVITDTQVAEWRTPLDIVCCVERELRDRGAAPPAFDTLERLNAELDRPLPPIVLTGEDQPHMNHTPVPPRGGGPVGVLFSAGIDSTIQIEWLLSHGWDVWPITFDDQSSMTVLKRDVALEFWLSRWNLHSKHIPIRYMRREELRQPSGFVPGWKLTMLTNALAYCDARGLVELHLGYLKDDRFPYPDEAPEVMQEVVALYNRVYQSRIELNLSLLDFRKSDILRWACDRKMPLEKTLSCRDVTVAGLTHCGRCDICRMRWSAFKHIGRTDPAYYLQTPQPVPKGTQLTKTFERRPAA